MTLEERLAELRAQIKALVDLKEISTEQAEELNGLMAKAEGVKAQIKAKAEVDEGDALDQEKLDEETQVKVDEAVEKNDEEWKAKYAKSNRLPFNVDNVPKASQFAELSPYDNLSAGDQAILIGILDSARVQNLSKQGATPNAFKALALKLSEDKTLVGTLGMKAIIRANPAFKTDEVMQQDLTSFGLEWVGIAYSQMLWEAIRIGSFVANKIPSVEVPPGHESIYLPIESTDPTWYKVAETEDHDSTMLFPVASVTSSKVTTGRVLLTLAKMGCRVPWSGELEEDSLIPLVAQLREQITVSGVEQLEHAIIDGDTETGATTNINDIGGTPTSTDLFLMFNGFRKSPLVTTTANSRSGGVLDENDYLETIKLMGTAGINAADISKTSFIQDANLRWKSLELAKTQTRDVFGSPTIENGVLTSIWGYKVDTSYNMHFNATDRKANTDGKVDQNTPGNNTTGSLLAVRWDQWKMGYRRRMTLETTRYPRSDSSEITALMRLGLIQRDTEAAAITYNLTV